jgi:RHS repeat-associated protein
MAFEADGCCRLAIQPNTEKQGCHTRSVIMFDPTVGRWFEEDPSGLTPGANLYEYVNNNPTNTTDPSGMEPPSFKGGPPIDTDPKSTLSGRESFKSPPPVWYDGYARLGGEYAYGIFNNYYKRPPDEWRNPALDPVKPEWLLRQPDVTLILDTVIYARMAGKLAFDSYTTLRKVINDAKTSNPNLTMQDLLTQQLTREQTIQLEWFQYWFGIRDTVAGTVQDLDDALPVLQATSKLLDRTATDKKLLYFYPVKKGEAALFNAHVAGDGTIAMFTYLPGLDELPTPVWRVTRMYHEFTHCTDKNVKTFDFGYYDRSAMGYTLLSSQLLFLANPPLHPGLNTFVCLRPPLLYFPGDELTPQQKLQQQQLPGRNIIQPNGEQKTLPGLVSLTREQLFRNADTYAGLIEPFIDESIRNPKKK